MWLLAGKAALQTLGSVLDSLLDRSLALNREIWYWDEIVGSYYHTGFYIVQTLPSSLWIQISDFYSSLKNRYNRQAELRLDFISNRWQRFYTLVQHSIQERSEWHARSSILSPFSRCRSELQRRQKTLRSLRDINASGIGLLMEECLAFGVGDDLRDGNHSLSNQEWRHIVYKSVLLMDATLRSLNDPNTTVTEFEDGVFSAVEHEIQSTQNQPDDRGFVQPIDVIDRLVSILQERLPENALSTGVLISKFGRPSLLVRYWLPVSTALLSLSTVLKILTSRKAELLTWLSEFSLTVVDFWTNWVVKPSEKLIGTIRHDEKSEIAIMSRNSLIADRASLERMVVDFILDRPDLGHEKVHSDINAIAANVRDGDLTPILRAYERDLRRPLIGTLRGDLIRAFLIQIQKTKVDVEVAIGGIDALLKSQELVFGFVPLFNRKCRCGLTFS
jgi:nuclear-control-of-ATPase protein 2